MNHHQRDVDPRAFARATVLVTGDRRHFGPPFGRRFGGTAVLSPREALAFLVEASGDSRTGSEVR